MQKIPQLFATLAILAGTLLPANASAQDPYDEDEAQVAGQYDLGHEHMKKRNYVVACPLFEEVVRKKPKSFGGRDSLGECYVATGRLVEAYAEFQQAEIIAEKDLNDPARKQKAFDKMLALRPQVSLVVIVVPKALRVIEGLQVLRDEGPIETTYWNVPLPIPTGQHTIVTMAPNRRPWTTQFEVMRKGDIVVIETEEPPLNQPDAPPKANLNIVPVQKPSSNQSTISGGGLVAGGVILTLGGVIMGVPGIASATDSQTTNTGLLLGGLAAIGIGIPLVYYGNKRLNPASPPSAPPASSARINFLIGPSSIGLGGTF